MAYMVTDGDLEYIFVALDEYNKEDEDDVYAKLANRIMHHHSYKTSYIVGSYSLHIIQYQTSYLIIIQGFININRLSLGRKILSIRLRFQ